MTTDAGTPKTEPTPLRKAMERAFNLGQTYWQQADHDFVSQHRKADVTMQKFRDFADATCAQYDGSLTAAEAERDTILRDFQRFHQRLCKAHYYQHDPADWQRDQLSLEEHICKRIEALRARVAALEAGLREALAALERVQPQVRGVLPVQDTESAIDRARALLAPSSEETK